MKSTLLALLEAGQQDRTVVCGREMTKLHEEFFRGSVRELADWIHEHPHGKGEFVLILAGASDNKIESDDDHVRDQLERLKQDGELRSEAVRVVADALGVNKRRVYTIALGMVWE